MTGRRKRAKKRGRVAPLRRAVDARLAAWRARVDALVAGGMDRRVAVAQVNAEDIVALAMGRRIEAGQREAGKQGVQAGKQARKPSVSVRLLRVACPGAPASFLVDMLEQGRTIAEAAALWRARRVAAEIEAERAARLAAEATVKAPVKATVASVGGRVRRNRYWL